MKHSEQAKAKMIEAQTGKHHTEQTKMKISKSLIGHPVSQETKDKIRQSVYRWNLRVEKTARAWAKKRGKD